MKNNSILKSILAIILSTGIVILTCLSCNNSQSHSPKESEYYIAAYVWPSCHDEPKAREIWPQGIGEWEVIKKADTRYEGHYQPKVPLWGYEMDNDHKVVEKWIDAAVDHGVNVFIYDWYWYNGGPFLESALNDGFLKARNNEKMYFYLMWANHNMPMRTLNIHEFKDVEPIFWSAVVDWENYTTIVEKVIREYFQKPNYLKIDGKPVFAIYRIEQLLESFGGCVDETRKGLDYFREEVKKAGFSGVHFQLIPSGVYWRRTVEMIRKDAELIEALGFSSVTTYNMEGFSEDYVAYGAQAVQFWENWNEALNIPFFPCISVGWDDSPRFPHRTMKNTVHYNKSPESFATMLAKAKQFVDNKHPDRPKLITIFAWNEWVEGSYLLPDMKYGFGYLEAVKDVMEGKYDRY